MFSCLSICHILYGTSLACFEDISLSYLHLMFNFSPPEILSFLWMLFLFNLLYKVQKQWQSYYVITGASTSSPRAWSIMNWAVTALQVLTCWWHQIGSSCWTRSPCYQPQWWIAWCSRRIRSLLEQILHPQRMPWKYSPFSWQHFFSLCVMLSYWCRIGSLTLTLSGVTPTSSYWRHLYTYNCC